MKRKLLHLFHILLLAGLTSPVVVNAQTASWEELQKRPIPAWFTQARFGIFIHWGLYSVRPGPPIRMPMALAAIMQSGTGSD
ncbi:MAG: alpha-L-fucosidase [Chitinophagaceae bacterium]